MSMAAGKELKSRYDSRHVTIRSTQRPRPVSGFLSDETTAASALYLITAASTHACVIADVLVAIESTIKRKLFACLSRLHMMLMVPKIAIREWTEGIVGRLARGA